MRLRLIVNADDAGLSGQINRAVLESLDKKYCSSTSILATGSAFDKACELLHSRGFQGSAGIHFVLTEGSPLTDGIRECPRFCDDNGRFVLTRRQRVWRLSPVERGALADELRAQIRACRHRGIPLTHADSHHHVHEEWAIASVVIAVCLEEGIPYLRLARNCGPCRSRVSRFYRNLVNIRIRGAGLARVRYFGTVEDFDAVQARGGFRGDCVPMEIMAHPRYNACGLLVDLTSGRTMEEIGRLLRAEVPSF